MRKVKLHTRILIGMILGVIIGIIFKEKAVLIKPIGTLFIRLITMIVVPLVFVSLFIGTASLGDIKKLGRIGVKAFLYFFITTAIAISIGVTLANIVKPGEGLAPEVQAQLKRNYQQEKIFDFEKLEEKPSLIQTLVNIVPTNPVKALAEGNMLQIIFLAIIFGITVTLIRKEKAKTVIEFFEGFNDTIIRIVHIVMKLAPYGVLALIAAVVGEFGIDILLPLFKYAVVVASGLLIYTLSINSLTVGLIGHYNPLKFFKNYRPAMLIAFSTSSSNAALPVAMECVGERMNVPKEVTSFVLPLGATINMDGTALYQGVAAIFIAQIYGMGLGITQQLTIILTATLASVGAAGVPGAGIITLAMVLQAINVPLEGIALILGVDRILDMLRTTTNIIGDAAGAIVVNATESEKK
jgi:Na+/H+-dicarboxylate symporter